MKILPLVLVMGLLGGCASRHRPTDPYAAVTVRRPALVEFEAAHEPPGIPEGPLTLRLAVDTALANNPEVAALGWDAAAAEARRDRAQSERLPKFNATGNYFHHLDDQRILPVGQPGDPALLGSDIFSGDVVLSLPLYTGGRLVNQVKAADLLQRAASQRLARTREELVFNVTSVFNSILAQKHVIESLEFSRKTLAEHMQRIDALIAARKAAKVDRMRTEVRLADIEQRLVREKNLRSIQHRSLANLLGLSDWGGGISPQGELELKERKPLPDLETALSTAWGSRGDYLAARSSLEAQAKTVDVVQSGRLPTVTLQGTYGGRWAAGPTAGTGDELGDIGRIGFLVELPIFDGGRVDADIREQKANLATAQQRLRSLDLRIRLEVETALRNVESSGERAAAIRKSIALARESLRIEQQKYDLGKGTIVDVLDAQAAQLEAETLYYQILAEYHTAEAQLRLAMGAE